MADFRAALAGSLCCLLAACSGGGTLPGASQHAIAPPSPSRAVRVPMHVKIPRMPRGARGRARRPFFVAASVQGLAIAVYAHGSRTTPLGTVNADVSPSSALCHASAGGRECTIPIPAPPGTDDFVVTAYDAPPAGGSFAAAKKLAIGEATSTIVTGAKNSVAITLGGVAAGVAIAPLQLFVRAIAPSSQSLSVTAVDADGDAIVSDGYVDASGNPVSIALSADSTAGGTVTFAPASLSSPSPTGVLVNYASNVATSTQIQVGFTSKLTATISGVSASTTLHAAPPTGTTYTAPGGGVFPSDIAPGPDSALWYTALADDHIGRVTTNGSFSTSGAISNDAEQIAAGIDNAMWFTERTGTIGRVSVSSPGTITEIAPPPSITLAAGIAQGPSSDAASMWFTDPVDGLIARIPTVSPSTASINVYGPVPQMLEPGAIVAGPDGNLWFADCTAGAIGKIPPNSPTGTSAQVTEYDVPAIAPGSSSPSSIVNGPDGALWFGDPTNGDDGEIGRITTAGVLTEYATAAGSYFLTVGPDGAIWFTESNIDKVGRIDPKTHAIVEFPTGSGPAGIALGPDNALYISNNFDSTIERLQ
jgi:virginiamycin B lyase